jgi:hypothetical protein
MKKSFAASMLLLPWGALKPRPIARQYCECGEPALRVI